MILDWWLSPELQVRHLARESIGESDDLAEKTRCSVPRMAIGPVTSEESSGGRQGLCDGV
jgi:hypothetical protein